MGKYKFIILHCTDTPEGRPVCSGTLKLWHLATSYIRSKEMYRFMRKEYKFKTEIKPYYVDIKQGNQTIKVDISQRTGRGWSRVGYSAMFHLNGEMEILIPWNDDDIIDSWEISNGVKGMNFFSRNIVYVGGAEKIHDKMRAKDTLTDSQFISIQNFMKMEIAKHPDILVAGHRQFAKKPCPSFDPIEKFILMGIPFENIYNPDNLDLKEYAKKKGIKL